MTEYFFDQVSKSKNKQKIINALYNKGMVFKGHGVFIENLEDDIKDLKRFGLVNIIGLFLLITWAGRDIAAKLEKKKGQ